MKNNKGITLITLTVAVLIMIILSSMLIYNAKNGLKIKNLKDMQNDIEILEDKVNAYYVKYAEVPAEIEYLGNINFEPQPNDDDKYYVLDLKALEGISLNYGSEFTQIKSEEDTYKYNDVYIINKQSMHIYYAKGIEIDGVAYYTNSEDESVTSYRGAYLVTQKEYANTLKEAVDMAQNGETIKVLKDVQEETPVEIIKNIIIDTNGKTITFNTDSRAIIVNQNANVSIFGNGTIENNTKGGTIKVNNNCKLIVEDTTIYSDIDTVSPAIGTMYVTGQLELKNAKINTIYVDNEIITINGGEYNEIGGRQEWNCTINGGNVKKIRVTEDASCTIKNGTIENIVLIPVILGNLNLTLGDINKEVNAEELIVKNMKMELDPTLDDDMQIVFNNGIIQKLDEDMAGFITEGMSGDNGYTVIREGYKVKKTDEGYILVPKS